MSRLPIPAPRTRRDRRRKAYDGHGTTTGAATTAPAPAVKKNPWYPDHAVFSATKDQLKAMPEFKYSTE